MITFEWLVGRHCTAVEAHTEHSTRFAFGDATFYVDALWRIGLDGRLRWTSQDDGQRYGLDRPVDARAEAAAALVGWEVLHLQVDLARGDVRIELSGDRLLEFLTDSHYESWELRSPEHHYVASIAGVKDIAEFRVRPGG